MIGITRREVITLLGGAAAWPLDAIAQQMGKLATIGVLGTDPSLWATWTAAFVQRLRELGWIDRRTVAIEYRWAQGNSDRYAEIAAEFIRLNVDVIVTTGSAVQAVKQATGAIPIVFPMSLDPIGGGLVGSLARPGGNITGLSQQATDVASKRVELLREVVPRLKRVGIMATIDYPAGLAEKDEVQAVARSVGLEVVTHEIRRPEDITFAFTAFKAQADALYVVVDALLAANITRIVT